MTASLGKCVVDLEAWTAQALSLAVKLNFHANNCEHKYELEFEGTLTMCQCHTYNHQVVKLK